MPDADALLAAVLADPADDFPRLVFADWLEEHGDADRAEFIRLQCELAGTADPPLAARARERTLLATRGAGWLAPLRADGEPLAGKGTHGQFVRGFVEVVWMPAAVFLRRADRLFARTPARELRVTRADPRELADLLAAPAVARLGGLDLSNRRFGPDLGRRLAASPRVAALRVLRVRACGLTDESALRLADAPFDWPLAELDVSLNPVGPRALEALGLRFGAGVVRWGGMAW